MNERNESGAVKDRKLGDEWESWSGNLDESKAYNETARLFTMFAAAGLFVILIGCGFILYMIEPRLNLLHHAWVIAARIVAAVVAMSSIVLSLLIIASVFTGKNLVLNNRLGLMAASYILPVAIAIANRAGIPRDRLGNSFVAFTNAIIKARQKPIKGKTIVIIPRCLKADTKKDICGLCDAAGISVFSATGGGQARKILSEERPAAVIAVACERDLVSGIRDVAHKIPTIGVTNKRPEGPCKNTYIEMDELRNAIKTLTGKAPE